MQGEKRLLPEKPMLGRINIPLKPRREALAEIRNIISSPYEAPVTLFSLQSLVGTSSPREQRIVIVKGKRR
ncbi:hypothetical protein B296_00051016 [Ensete ventricosum]|uniref:Uncharacterized protein n=1 Tax=Ensete ventricosum TaxID=4639 RepID=A0A426YDQ1_ENSVE|nr:hypothetical protein B296_00051016 [Ensete ventricosum]